MARKRHHFSQARKRRFQDFNGHPASPTLGPLFKDPLSEMFDTTFHNFRSVHGICGLARKSIDQTSVDILALHAMVPGTGQFHRFIAALKEEFNVIQIRDVINPWLPRVLARYGFVEKTIPEHFQLTKLWQWQRNS